MVLSKLSFTLKKMSLEKGEIMQHSIQQRLFELQDLQYREFCAKLVPTIDKELIIGVRIPSIRKLANEVAKENPQLYLSIIKDQYFEEKMLRGMVIGYTNFEFKDQLSYIKKFIPEIDNWSICDSFCSGLKSTKKNLEVMWDFIQPFAASDEEYKARFAAVMLLNYFVNENYIHQTISLLDTIQNGKFYTQMAVAWAISICYIKFPIITEAYLQTSTLDRFTYNKALQKIIESNRIDHKTKEKIRRLKRK